MKTIKMEVELTYDDKSFHHQGTTKAMMNFYRDGLMGQDLELRRKDFMHTGRYNDTFIGKVKAISIKMPIPKNKNQNNKKEIQLDL